MGIMFLTDLHLDNYRPFSKIMANGMNSRLLDQMNVVKEVAAIIGREKPEAVIFLGDLFNGFTESLPKIIYTAGFLTVDAWSKNTPLYMIVGNHDIYRGMHVFSTFESLPNVKVISDTYQTRIGKYIIDMVPWNRSLPFRAPGDICTGHIEVQGAVMEAKSGHVCTTGLEPPVFATYKFALLGHFHTPQKIEIPKSACDCRYIGAVMQMDRRTTSNSALGVTLLEDGNLRLVNVKSPRIYEYIIDNEDDKTRFLDESLDDENYFRVTVTNPLVDFPDYLERVMVEYDLPAVVSNRLNLPADTLGNIQIKSAVETFIDRANTVLDKTLLKELAKELLE